MDDSLQLQINKLAESIVAVMRKWKDAYWAYQIKGDEIRFTCQRTYDTRIRVVSGNAFPGRVLHLDLAEPQVSHINESIDGILTELYPRAFQKAFRELPLDLLSSFQEVCSMIVLHLTSGRDITISIAAKRESKMNAKNSPPAKEQVTKDEKWRKANKVFVVHGRDELSRTEVCKVIESMNLKIVSWNEIVIACGKATPHTSEIVEKAFEMAQAFVVLFTEDDEVRLAPQWHNQEKRGSFEKKNHFQPRPNVLVEAGWAMGKDSTRTVIIEIGEIKIPSDLLGLNTVRTDKADWVDTFEQRLRAAKCKHFGNKKGQWYTPGLLPKKEAIYSSAPTKPRMVRKSRKAGKEPEGS